MGIGASYFEEESTVYGIPFYLFSQERLLRLEEAIQIICKMGTEEPSTSFEGAEFLYSAQRLCSRYKEGSRK